MNRLLAAALLLTPLLALPTAAQAEFGRANCAPHRNGEVRCAVRLNIPGGNATYTILVHPQVQGTGIIRAQADTWLSTCGSGGVMNGSTNIQGGGERRVGTFQNMRNDAGAMTQGIFGYCVEVFLLNCTRDGQRTACDQAIIPGSSTIVVR